MSSTPYCKTCHKAGKSYSEYTNHWTRDTPGPNGRVICPIVLNSICSYCRQHGHWRKYCQNIDKQNKTIVTTHFIYENKSKSWANILKYQNNRTNSLENSGTYVGFTWIKQNLSRPPSPDYPPPNW